VISFDGKETFESMTLVKKGKAGTLGSRYAGSLRFEFDDGIVIVMNRILSVHYFIEFLDNANNYPYPSRVLFEMGLYECSGSSYCADYKMINTQLPPLKKASISYIGTIPSYGIFFVRASKYLRGDRKWATAIHKRESFSFDLVLSCLFSDTRQLL